ncbi:MAG TPA: RodZ domain-containing protein [Vicinamibacterales bacterium]|nr:RodZ domain-containing protein [Vicinamibacterales bacterium]
MQSPPLQQPPDVGPTAWLRQAREERGLTLEDVARSTKIAVATLTALEAGNVAKLPATIFTRGFIKAYASEVGLDPDETADLYLAQLAPETLAADAAVARLKIATPVERAEVRAFDEDNSRLIKQQQSGRFGKLLLAAAVVGLIAYVGAFRLPSFGGSSPDAAAVAPATPPPAAPAPAPTDAAPAALTATAADVANGPLQFQLKPQGPCWVSATADGTRVMAELMEGGTTKTIQVRDELLLRVGDPETCAFSINGQAGRPLGVAGAPVNVRITKENYREFLGM